MRHRVDHRKLGRTRSHRKAMLANMVTSLFDKERIKTTDARAKEARRTAERLITRAKKGYAAYQEHQSLKDEGKEAESRQMQAVALAHWRQASRIIKNGAVLKKLFDVIAPQYMEREGGYTRIMRLSNRLGDNAKTVLLELVGTEVTSEPMRKKGKKRAAGAEEAPAAADEKKETSKKEAPKKKASKKEASKKEASAKDTEKPAGKKGKAASKSKRSGGKKKKGAEE